jgi:hypothetical protein
VHFHEHSLPSFHYFNKQARTFVLTHSVLQLYRIHTDNYDLDLVFCLLSAEKFHRYKIILQAINFILDMTWGRSGTNALSSMLTEWRRPSVINHCLLKIPVTWFTSQRFIIFTYFFQNIQSFCGPKNKACILPTCITHYTLSSRVTRCSVRPIVTLVWFLGDYIWVYSIN